jgi:hypothetical protein
VKASRIFLQALMSAGVIGVCASAGAAQSNVPLPPIRPPDLATPAPQVTPVQPSTPVQPNAADNETLRAQVPASRRLIGKALPGIDDKGGCVIAAPLRLDAIVLADGTKVTLMPAVVMRASLASAVGDWVRDDLAPAVRLASIEGAGAYECRSRDSVMGAKLSEHAIGNALDLHALRTQQGKLFVIAPSKDDPDEVKSFRALMKKTACLRFSTVLGPGVPLAEMQAVAAHSEIDMKMLLVIEVGGEAMRAHNAPARLS